MSLISVTTAGKSTVADCFSFRWQLEVGIRHGQVHGIVLAHHALDFTDNLISYAGTLSGQENAPPSSLVLIFEISAFSVVSIFSCKIQVIGC